MFSSDMESKNNMIVTRNVDDIGSILIKRLLGIYYGGYLKDNIKNIMSIIKFVNFDPRGLLVSSREHGGNVFAT